MTNDINSPQVPDQEVITKKQWITPEMITIDLTQDSGARMDGADFENS